MNRSVTIIRKKAISGCACKFSVEINGKKMGVVENGQTVTLPLPEGRCVMALRNSVPLTSSPAQEIIEAYEGNVTYKLELKPRKWLNEWVLAKQQSPQAAANGRRKESIQLLSGMMCMLTKDHLIPKMREFRQQGLTLYMILFVGETSAIIAPDENRTGCTVGEAVNCNYAELTSDPRDVRIDRLDPDERTFLADELEFCLRNHPDMQLLNVERHNEMLALSLK